jgi:glycosyltransferase involved in cell wall biosynthesis
VRIAIDARKLRDYGIGTYIRNLLRHLARLDDRTEYVILCRSEDRTFAEELGENFRAVPEQAGAYSIREQLAVPLDLRREGANLFHAPHYVLPPLTPCRAVVTIHDCIHLRFPQYLPNRLGYAYARGALWVAAHRSARVLTVSEASKRDILQYLRVPDSKITVIPNAIDERFSEDPPADEVMRVRERYQLNDPFVLYAGNIRPHKNLERLIEAFYTIRRGDLEHVKLLIIGGNLEVCDAQAHRAPLQAAQARAVLRVRPGRHPGDPLPPRAGVRLPLPVRRVRPAAARSHGQRHARHHLERVVAARGRRRRGDADRSLRAGRHRGRHAACDRRRPAAR